MTPSIAEKLLATRVIVDHEGSGVSLRDLLSQWDGEFYGPSTDDPVGRIADSLANAAIDAVLSSPDP